MNIVENKNIINLQENKEKIINLLLSTKREGIEKLVTYLNEKTDFFIAPASTKYHNNFEGGLLDHSLKVYITFDEKNRYYKLGIKQESIVITSLCHDICKANFYVKGFKNVKEGKKLNYAGKEVDNWIEKEVWEVDDKLPLGHGAKSVILLQRFIDLTEFEVMTILWHMGTPESYEDKQAYNKAVEKYPAIIALHTSDYESSYLLETTIK